MGSKKTKIGFLSNLYFLCLFFLPIAIALSWSFEPSIRAIIATASLPNFDIDEHTLSDDGLNRELKRNFQKHFLKYSIYLPLEDIVTVISENVDQVFAQIMRKSCGSSKLYIWVPLQIRLPLIKSKTFEYCLRIE